MKKIIKYVFADILRNKIVIFYTVFLLGLSLAIFNLEDNSSKGLISLLNIILFTVPLICIIFSSIYVYNSSEFIELLVSQPLKRSSIWLSIYSGLTGSLSLAFFTGAGVPILIYAPSFAGIMMLLLGLLLTIVFISIAVLSAVTTRDKARGIGKAILLWLYFSILFDGIILFLLFQLADYPIEKAMLAVTAFNPIDLARIVILLQMDISALMGYTGAIFRDVFGNFSGVLIAISILVLWAIIPLLLSVRKFNKKDL